MTASSWVALGVAGGVSILLAIAVLTLIAFAKTRAGRADQAADQWRAQVLEAAQRERERDLARADAATRAANEITLTTALADQRLESARLERAAAMIEEQLHDVVRTMGTAAPTEAVVVALRSAAAGLRADLARLRGTAGGDAVPDPAAAAAPGHPDREAAGELHDPADVRGPGS